jgi:hypothetical protein
MGDLVAQTSSKNRVNVFSNLIKYSSKLPIICDTGKSSAFAKRIRVPGSHLPTSSGMVVKIVDDSSIKYVSLLYRLK